MVEAVRILSKMHVRKDDVPVETVDNIIELLQLNSGDVAHARKMRRDVADYVRDKNTLNTVYAIIDLWLWCQGEQD